MSSRSPMTPEWEIWLQDASPVRRMWEYKIRPRIPLVVAVIVAVIEVAVIGYWMGSETGASADRAAEVEAVAFQHSFDGARRDVLPGAELEGRQEGIRTGMRAAERAGADAGTQAGAAAVAEAQAAIAAAAAAEARAERRAERAAEQEAAEAAAAEAAAPAPTPAPAPEPAPCFDPQGRPC
jgi:hypothetical protein